MPDYWKELRAKLKTRNGVSHLWGKAANPGLFTIEIYHEDMPMPLCVVWFGFIGLNGIQIDNSFVFEKVRRCGLRTLAHDIMRKSWPDKYILSGAGTKSGAAWMRSVGYRQTSAGWEYHPKHKN